MPWQTLKKLIIVCKRNISTLHLAPRTKQVLQQRAKYLGKFQKTTFFTA